MFCNFDVTTMFKQFLMDFLDLILIFVSKSGYLVSFNHYLGIYFSNNKVLICF